MTPNDAPASGPGAGRRRALGRGPGTTSRPRTAEPHPAPPEPAPATVAPAPIAPASAEPPPPAVAEPAPAPPPDPAPAPIAPASAEPPPLAEPSPPAVAEPAPAVPDEVAANPARPSGTAVPEPPRPSPEGGSVESGAGAAGESAADGVFKVRLANFEGPFDLLLQLISKHKLDVTEVALSKVTDEFMAHIRAMGPDWDLDQTTEFLVVAATLLDLKAARLLPAAEVEDEADLALLEARDLLFARLLQYRAYKRIADIFNERLDEEARRHPRTVGLEPQHAELLPEVVISIGPEGFARLAVRAMQPKAKPEVYVDHIHAPLVSVQEQAGIVVARLRELGEADFRALVEDTDDTLTVVARFLALLELYREKAVALEQETALGELLVRWTGGDTDTAPMVTDEFDRPPAETEEEKKA
ncbi:segregation and condensation protein A [Streptomyces cellostaticus]|uniref:segregation and condensation protein A n=1 Tax=Streptomyces cellostaticus TaxID=67285 RepID=UPI0020264007|nr:segregation/condensation protein A [Streptomyces cellostaticus]